MKPYKFQVKPIDDMIQDYQQIKSSHPDVAVIVITRNKYEYSFKPLLHLDFDDITMERPGMIAVEQRHIDSIIKKLPEIQKASIIFVCCDAGISRSPAVAKALAHYLHDITSFSRISYRYPYANQFVFETILQGLQHSKFKELNFQ